MVVYKIVECFFMIEGVLGLGLYCLVNLILIKPAIAAAVQISPQRCLGTGIIGGFHHEKRVVARQTAGVGIIAIEVEYPGVNTQSECSGLDRCYLGSGSTDN